MSTNSSTAYDFNSDGIVIVKTHDYYTYDIDSINEKAHDGFKIIAAAGVANHMRKISIDKFLQTISCDNVVVVDITPMTYTQCNIVASLLHTAGANYIVIMFSPQQCPNTLISLMNQLPDSVHDVKLFQHRIAGDIVTEYDDIYASAIADFICTSKIKSFTLQAKSAEPYMLEIIINAIVSSDSIQTFTIIESTHLESLRLLCKRKSPKPFRLNIKCAIDSLDDNTLTCLKNFKQLHTIDIRITGRKFVESIIPAIVSNPHIRVFVSEMRNDCILDAISNNMTAVRCNQKHLFEVLKRRHLKTIEVDYLYEVNNDVHREIVSAVDANTTMLKSDTLRHFDKSIAEVLHRNNTIAGPNVTKALTDIALIFVNILPPYVLVEVFDWISPYYYTHVSLKTKVELVLRIYAYCRRR